MAGRLLRLLASLLVVSAAGMAGLALALGFTPPGRALLARVVADRLEQRLDGRVRLGGLGGTLLGDLVLRDLAIDDARGRPILRVGRLRARYRVPNLLAGALLFADVRVEAATLALRDMPDGRLNVAHLLRLGAGAPGGPAPRVTLQDVTLDDVRVEVARGGRSWVVDGVHAELPLVRLTAAGGVDVDIDRARARLADPALQVTDAQGRLRVAGDTLFVSLTRLALPNSAGPVSGAVSWGDGLSAFASVDARRLDLGDLAGLLPDVPRFTGAARVLASVDADGSFHADADRIALARGPERVAGQAGVWLPARGTPVVRDLDLRLEQVRLAHVRPWLDPVLVGALTGTVRADGPLDRLRLAAGVTFRDEAVPGRPVSRVRADGGVRAAGEGALAFDSLHVREADVALATIARLLPALRLPGRAELAGTLHGPWRNVTYAGSVRHAAPDLPASAASGRVRLDTRTDTLALAADVRLEPLALDGIRPQLPGLAAEGSLRGHLRLLGTARRMLVDADLEGDAGALRGGGTLTWLPDERAARGLDLTVRDLDLARLDPALPRTRLTGSVLADLTQRDGAPLPDGTLAAALAPSRVLGVPVDTAIVSAVAIGGLARVDTLRAAAGGVRVEGGGSLALAGLAEGELQLRLVADSLGALDPLVAAMVEGDSVRAGRLPLEGRATGTLRVTGAAGHREAQGRVRVDAARVEALAVQSLEGVLRWREERRQVRARLRADTLRLGGRAFHRPSLRVDGRGGALAWALRTAGPGGFDLDAQGRAAPADSVPALDLDSLAVAVGGRTWRLLAPARLTADSAPRLSALRLATDDGTGVVSARGRVPGSAPGALAVEAFGVDLADLDAAAIRDSLALRGRVGLSVQVGGTAELPVLRGAVTLVDAGLGDVTAPFVGGTLEYADRVLTSSLRLWRTGVPLLRADARLPIDLALRAARRRTEGALAVLIRADDADLAIAELLTPSLRRVRGTFDAEVRVAGSWARPLLSGYVQLDSASATVPALGVRYDTVLVRAELAGDSLTFRRGRFTAGQGALELGGRVRFADLARPELDLALAAGRFPALDVRGYLSAELTGLLRLRGPWDSATVTGRAVATRGTYYFADLVNKAIVDLFDPMNADLIDTLEVGRRTLKDAFHSRFLDRLVARDLLVTLGSDVWLRSNEANVKLGGDLRVNKAGRVYRIDGLLNAERGEYQLRLGPVSRPFLIDRGTVRLLGTPDLNGELDLGARHLVRALDGGEVPIIARITGTVLNPKLSLGAEAGSTLSEADVSSYLLTGQPASTGVNVGGQVAGLAGNVLGALASELERAAVNQQVLGARLTELRFRPGLQAFGQGATAVSLNRLEAGVQVGERTFLTLNAGFCFVGGQQAFTRGLFGAGVEYRFSSAWRFQAAWEPAVQACLATAGSALGQQARFQLGGDVLWQKEF
ncbi:MAG: translocation/assembly module TamB domain-containing protein [Gemmatimonadales bacterium]|nr:translocation/assembly module TamB domain-containing protein [Gemmatimonadales bacterium]